MATKAGGGGASIDAGNVTSRRENKLSTTGHTLFALIEKGDYRGLRMASLKMDRSIAYLVRRAVANLLEELQREYPDIASVRNSDHSELEDQPTQEDHPPH